MLAITTVGVIALTALGYWRAHEDDPGLTIRQSTLAAGLAATVAIVFAARSPLHRFVRGVLTEDEIKDALIFAGATLVVLPLLPDQPMGPYGALNPHTIWIIVILVMAISATGYVAVRMLGARFGLPIAGLASGFISSTATIGAMGARAVKTPDILAAAVAGAVLSTVATMVQLALVLAATSMVTLRTLSVPLICAGLAAVAYGAVFTIPALRQKAENKVHPGRAFSISGALLFALTLSCILVASAALREWFEETGIIVAAALAGFVDTHSAAISVASLVASGKMNAIDSAVPILAGFSTNTLSKMLFSCTSGGRSFALRVIPGLILVAVAAWAGVLISG